MMSAQAALWYAQVWQNTAEAHRRRIRVTRTRHTAAWPGGPYSSVTSPTQGIPVREPANRKLLHGTGKMSIASTSWRRPLSTIGGSRPLLKESAQQLPLPAICDEWRCCRNHPQNLAEHPPCASVNMPSTLTGNRIAVNVHPTQPSCARTPVCARDYVTVSHASMTTA